LFVEFANLGSRVRDPDSADCPGLMSAASYLHVDEEAAPLNGHSFGCLQIVADSTPRGAERVDGAKGDKLPRCTIPL
jgi:hypothetical protein